MHRDILPQVIFSPGQLALQLADGLVRNNIEVTLYTPGPVDTSAISITADMSYFEQELAGRGDTYMDLLKKHPFTFITLARQVQSEIISRAYADGNNGKLDIIHVYTNEEDTALPFAKLSKAPVIFTHHDPFNFLVKYKNVFPKYTDLNWLSLSLAQRKSMPENTNWVGNIYHGLDPHVFQPLPRSESNYVAYFGRIIEPKGVHLAIAAVREYNKHTNHPIKLKIAGKHYSGNKDTYWQTQIEPELDDIIEYVGFIKDDKDKNVFLGNAKALIIPSIFDEPFGMVMIEALACSTPLIGIDSGSIAEIITSETGILIPKTNNDTMTTAIARAIGDVSTIDRTNCRADFEKRFTNEHMCQKHISAYKQLLR